MTVNETTPIIVDLFAGGGGASTGIEWALGRSPDVAVNHDAEAVAMHAANHPETRHLCGDVWHYAPREVTQGRPVDLLWASPTCTFFSKAKGGPLNREIATKVRGLAWVVVRYAREVQPRVIAIENVSEFRKWGPLLASGKPCPRRKGKTFRAWVKQLERAGYVVEVRELAACDYGAPTTRKRLFMIARCDGQPIVWPQPTHGKGLAPYRSAAECIDWTIPVRSIFERKKPLAKATLRRIARGMQKFVFDAAKPFVIPVSHSGDARVHDIDEPLRTVTASSRSPFSLVAPTLIQTSYGERKGQAPRTLDLHEPLGTVVAGGQKHGLCFAYLAKHFGGHESPGQQMTIPMSTVTCKDHHALVTAATTGDRRGEVRAFLTQYNGTSVGQPLQLPLGTITTRDRFGVVTVHGEDYAIADIGMRLLAPRELYRAQGFKDSYVIDPIVTNKRGNRVPLSLTAQIRMCGNSVSPYPAAAIIRANVPWKEAVAA
jgi:DNA (cytosine-5)-methyltransferase 1